METKRNWACKIGYNTQSGLEDRWCRICRKTQKSSQKRTCPTCAGTGLVCGHVPVMDARNSCADYELLPKVIPTFEWIRLAQRVPAFLRTRVEIFSIWTLKPTA